MKIERRTILKGLAASPIALAAPPYLRTVSAQAGTLDVAAVYSLSGTFANVGTLLNNGSQWAMESFGEVLGRKINYILLDDRGDAGEAVRKVQEVMSQRGVKHVIGCTNSAIALAVQKEVHSRGGVYVQMAGADESTGKDCNKANFRWPVASYSAVNATVRPLIEKFPNAKKWYTITGQYVFGDSLLTNVKDVLKEKNLQHVGNSYHSLADREYSGFIATALAAQPDVILANYSGITEADYEKLSQIADTVAYPDQPWTTPWRDVITTVGEALGETDAADQLLSDIDAEVAAKAEEHPEFQGKTIAAVANDPTAFYVYTPADPRVEYLEDLGFEIAPSVAELDTKESTFYYTLSPEEVDKLDSDILLSYVSTEERAAEIAADPTFNVMPQYQAGTVADVVGDSYISSVSPPTALSLTWGLDYFVDSLVPAAQAAG